MACSDFPPKQKHPAIGVPPHFSPSWWPQPFRRHGQLNYRARLGAMPWHGDGLLQPTNSTDWFKGKSTRNNRFSHEIWGFPVDVPFNQSIDKCRFWSDSIQIYIKGLIWYDSLIHDKNIESEKNYHKYSESYIIWYDFDKTVIWLSQPKAVLKFGSNRLKLDWTSIDGKHRGLNSGN